MQEPREWIDAGAKGVEWMQEPTREGIDAGANKGLHKPPPL